MNEITKPIVVTFRVFKVAFEAECGKVKLSLSDFKEWDEGIH